ncbi:uncharacterized protein STEHIDRAFT_152356 [Stereum hirsutum FP-91666 SS1]|uniref:uncharacterized protein n=1 Tax=Stereum hirsutum (strain FP-91666) TaxID=721885 RepID=UPI000440F1B9|nr:uncharacterized protein STEHIDRAFT_152356 [Stereum hirsutum FP-91666 SS1]EIM90644.1 hypothetical protein STEHIDRAFT_152356 [Stereum hirsutum FP-91666 SS1]
MVMKTAWRQSGRNLGSSIHHGARNAIHSALAEYIACDGVIYPRRDLLDDTPAQRGISAHLLHNSAPVDEAKSHVLHRLMLNTIGGSVWTYTSDLELLNGLRSAVQAHQLLFDQGILYHDISPENIALMKDPRNLQPGREGFLSDLECFLVEGDPRFKSEMDHADAIQNIRDVSGDVPPNSVAHVGAIRTGSVHFMAIEILDAIVDERPIEYSIEHDIESFIWVLAYAVMRKSLKVTEASEAAKHSGRKQLDADFKQSFGSLPIAEIALSRRNAGPFDFIINDKQKFLSPYLSGPLRDLLVFLQTTIRDKFHAPVVESIRTVYRRGGVRPPETVVLTHAWLIDYLDDTIQALENDPSLQR